MRPQRISYISSRLPFPNKSFEENIISPVSLCFFPFGGDADGEASGEQTYRTRANATRRRGRRTNISVKPNPTRAPQFHPSNSGSYFTRTTFFKNKRRRR